MSKPVGELIVNVPAPGSDQRENQTPTLLESKLIETRVVRAHLDRRVGNIEFDWPHATGFEVDEDDSSWGTEEVARVRFSVQQLVGGATALYGLACAVKRAQKKVTVTVIQRGALASVRDNTLRRRDALHEMRCFDLDVSHGCV